MRVAFEKHDESNHLLRELAQNGFNSHVNSIDAIAYIPDLDDIVFSS